MESSLTTVHGVTLGALGIILKDMAEAGMNAIRNQLDSFSFESKDNPDKIDDQVTSADYAAQAIIVNIIAKSFPLAGIIAEESNLSKPCHHPSEKLYFTIDPLDGTRAYVRMQSDGIGSMIGVVLDNEIIGAAIADVMTKEIYLLDPEDRKVKRIHPRRAYDLVYVIKEHKRLAMVDDPRGFIPDVAMISYPKTGFYESVSVTNGSIGTNVARIWKSEASAFVFKASKTTKPWDWVPVYGISKAMGFIFLVYNEATSDWIVTQTPWSLETISFPESILIHESEIELFRMWLQKIQ